MLEIEHFRAEGLERGCVTDKEQPRFSWNLKSSRNKARPQGAELSVCTEEEGKKSAWTCRMEEGTGIAVPYHGKALQPFGIYHADLTAEDDSGETAVSHLTFEMGRMGTPWSGKWITDGEYRFTEKKVTPVPLLFRRTMDFSAHAREHGGIRRARVYATAMGIYALYLNGKKVGGDYFTPGFTSYKNQLQYQTCDVTKALSRGKAVLTAAVAGGWAVGRFTYKNRNRIFADRQALLAEVRVVYGDGTAETVGTDETWDVTQKGPFREAEFYNGEVFDAGRAGLLSGEDAEGAGWHSAAGKSLRIHPEIIAAYGSPVREHEVFRPVRVTKSLSGTLVYDMGQNFAGIIHAKIRGAEKGRKIVFTHAEVLMNGELCREPLRTAKQEAVYLCAGDGEETYQPTLTYMGFRYVGVSGVKEEDLELTGIALYSDISVHGGFSCSNAMLNQLQSTTMK